MCILCPNVTLHVKMKESVWNLMVIPPVIALQLLSGEKHAREVNKTH